MSSKAARRRQRKQARQQVSEIVASVATEAAEAPRTKDRPVRPTAQRLAQGRWNMPSGPGKREQPMTDEASDMIGRLFIEKQITGTQEQTARRFIELYDRYLSSIGVGTVQSCLSGGAGAYDSGDGDPEVEKAYKAVRSRVGRVKIALLQVECYKLAHESPRSLSALENALDCMIKD